MFKMIMNGYLGGIIVLTFIYVYRDANMMSLQAHQLIPMGTIWNTLQDWESI